MTTNTDIREAVPSFVEEVTNEATDAEQAADVLAYLQEEAEAKAAERAAQQEKLDAPKYKEVDLSENPNFNMTFSADPIFEKNKQEQDTKTFFAAIADEQVPITDDDQARYMKAMLNDTDVHLELSMMGGQFNVECRAISVYEADMVLLAALRMSGSEGKDVPTALLPGCAQQIRVAMQTVKINGKDADPIYVEANRADQDNEINKLISRVDARLSRMNAAKYGMLVRALNVFEHKLSKMNALAYTGNFWKPVETD